MDQFLLIVALLTAGISLAIGSVNFFLGLKSKNRTDLIFGTMGVLLFAFILMPPMGFIIDDQSPYPAEILLKRFFIFSYYCLLPWFIYHYTSSQDKKLPTVISAGVIISYLMMMGPFGYLPRSVWVYSALLLFGANLFYGLYAGTKQYQRNEKTNAQWFLAAISAYGVLFLLTALNQFGIDLVQQVFDVKLFLSIHFHAVFLVFIMGIRVIGIRIDGNINERFRLEKVIQSGENRWKALVESAPVFIKELDAKGNIVYINQCGVKLLGFTSLADLVGRNWFDVVTAKLEVRERKISFSESLNDNQDLYYFVESLQCNNGDPMLITWNYFHTYSDSGDITGRICVGINSTGEENAKRLISQLRLELEKEKIHFSNEQRDELSEEIIGNSDAIRYAIDKARQVAKTNAPVLLEGETGVGKELIADLIHKTSSRSNAPLVKVNCGALPKELIEDELFGHEKGAFTSAIQSRKGRFELADGGTIFLDELGELPLDMQPKLLRVLQNGEFQRVGGQKTIKVDVRVVAATNRDLQQEVQQGRFRDDLFYRLNVFPITIPPLRKRKEDLPVLINHFINQESKKYNRPLENISKADLQRLMDYSWPGNVRELRNIIERSVIASEGNTLRLEWFLKEVEESGSGGSLEEIERQHILKIMEASQWKINGENGAAEKLDMHPNTLRSKMKKLGIYRPSKNLS